MAIRSGDVPLGINEILTDITGSVGERADLVGLGVLVGATSGVVGAGDNVILPGDFYGEDITLTATAGNLSPSSHTFGNTGGDLTVTISSLNGIFRFGNVPGWLAVSPTYGSTSNTSITFSAPNNSALGALDRTSVSVQLIGASNSVLDTISVGQDGNEVTFNYNPTTGLAASDYKAGTLSRNFEASSDFKRLVMASSNTNLATVATGSATGTNPITYPITLTHFLDYNTGSNQTTSITTTGYLADNTTNLVRTVTFTKPPYETILWQRDTDHGEDGPLELDDTAGSTSQNFTGATSIPYNSTQTPPGGHDWTCTIPSGSSFLSLSSTTGNYHPNGDGKVGGSSDPGDSSVTINFTDNNTGAERGGLILLEDDTSGQTHELRVFQPARKLTTFSITSNQADTHSLALPAKADLSFGTWSYQVVANSGFQNTWESYGQVTGNGQSGTNYYYSASLLQHSSDNGITFVPITTTISGSGSGNILVKQTSGYWVDFDDPMKYPYYRFRSQAYPSEYSEYPLTITQPSPTIDFDLEWGSTNNSSNQLASGGSINLKVYSNTNTIAMNVYGDNASSLNISATIRLASSFSTTNFLANTSTSYAATNWSTHLDSSQNTAGRIYLMEFTVRSTTSSPTQTVSQWVNVYAKSTGQTQSEGYNAGGYIRFYIQESTGGGGGSPPPPGGGFPPGE